jgi:hypothetical protein
MSHLFRYKTLELESQLHTDPHQPQFFLLKPTRASCAVLWYVPVAVE